MCPASKPCGPKSPLIREDKGNCEDNGGLPLPVRYCMSAAPTLDTNALALVDLATSHVRDILTLAIEHAPPRAALLVADRQCTLTTIVAEAYRRCLPDATFIDFDTVTPDDVLAAFAKLVPGDLVVLVQSTNFRLEAFRIRVELFKRGLKVVEHPHLSRMTEAEIPIYIDALAYDPVYTRGTGLALKACIDKAQGGVIDTGGEQLTLGTGLEPAKLNVGDYRQMKNVGGQFPIGEVFTESLDLEAVHGRLRIASFGDTAYRVNRPEHPITLIIEKGRVVGTEHSTPEFDLVLDNIRRDEGQIWVRELGFGLNRAFTQERRVTDIGTYERMCGIHLSLGCKHTTYDKPQISRSRAKYHVDVMALTNTFTLDGQVVYRDGAWQVP